MSTEMITVRNTINGLVTKVRPNVLLNPTIGKYLVEVEEDAKPQLFIKPATAEEYVDRRSNLDFSENTDTTEEG